jgi:dienelactone hydrolase
MAGNMKAIMRLLQVLLFISLTDGARAEAVEFPGENVTLRGELFRPDGSGPFPAVVALHGCGGLYSKTGGLSPRHEDWAKRLVEAGFIVLFPDSFGSRGAVSQCRTEDRVARSYRERPDDAIAAARYLKARSDVKPGAINLLGWSNGGSTVLYTLRNIARNRAPQLLAKAIAFYPGCRVPLQRGNWHSDLPLLVLIGEADDWTPAEPCRALVSRAEAAGEPVSIVTYPGAYHDFDHPNQRIRSHSGLAFTARGDGVAHSGTHAAARADSIFRVLAFLMR